MFKIDVPIKADILVMYLWIAGYDAYVVGGCVRDSLLGKKPHDWDICTDATPEQVRKVMHKHKLKTIDTGIQHGTITVIRNDEPFEITTFRVDGEYSDNRRPDHVEFVGDVVEDLSRRDFTINAMAYSDADGLIDPWGGYGDLDAKLIRCVRNPDDRFREDALRIMRALRFAATYGFEIEEKTSEAIHRNKDLLKNIAAERIQSELTKMLCGKGVLDILLEYKDVMAVIIPELEPCIGFEQNNPYHVYDVYGHIAHAVANYKGDDISIKMALLLHDIGKPECYTEDHNGGHFYGHSVPSTRIAKDVMERLRFDNKTKNEVVDLVLYHDADIHPGVRSVKRWMNKIGPEMLDHLLDVKIADIRAHSPINRSERIGRCIDISDIASEIEQDQMCFTLKQLAVNGRDILSFHVPEGPIVGNVLKHLLDKVINGELENDHDVLMGEAEYYIKRRSS